MNSRRLLALLVMGCSSSTHSANRSSSGGSSNAGDDSGVYSGDNSQCAIWPQERLFPWVGPFFYGPDKGPCSYTETDQPGTASAKTFTPIYTYDSNGLITQALTRPGDNSNHNIQYSYASGLLSAARDFNAGITYDIKYYYGADSAGYTSTIEGSDRVTKNDYTLDPKGYPMFISYSVSVSGQDATPTDVGVRFVFEYENCRIVKRTAYKSDGTEYPPSSALFTYDDVGHLVEISSPSFEYSYDYSCWAPQDAGP